MPSGLAENFPGIAALKALDIPVTGETSVELSKSGKFLAAEAKLKVNRGAIVPPWDPDNAMQIDRGNLDVVYSEGMNVVEIKPSTLSWGKSHATFSGEFRAVREGEGAPSSWNFKLKADNAVLAAEEFGLAPMKVDEWQAEGNLAADGRRLTLSAVHHPLRRRFDRSRRQYRRRTGIARGASQRAGERDAARYAQAVLAEIPGRGCAEMDRRERQGRTGAGRQARAST